eukprot:3033150-Pleurochrysis_carterae.AAC.2
MAAADQRAVVRTLAGSDASSKVLEELVVQNDEPVCILSRRLLAPHMLTNRSEGFGIVLEFAGCGSKASALQMVETQLRRMLAEGVQWRNKGDVLTALPEAAEEQARALLATVAIVCQVLALLAEKSGVEVAAEDVSGALTMIYMVRDDLAAVESVGVLW